MHTRVEWIEPKWDTSKPSNWAEAIALTFEMYPEVWTRNVYAKDLYDNVVSPVQTTALCFCQGGLVIAACDKRKRNLREINFAWTEAACLARTRYDRLLLSVNDYLGREAVIDLYREASKQLRERGL